MSKKGNSVFQDIINIGANAFTGGAVGFEADNGGFGKGVVLDATVDAIKEITGATAQEEATQQQRDQFDTEQANIKRDREDALAQKSANQLAKSNRAGGARRGRSKSSSNTSANTTVGAGGKDFLGL